MVTTNYNNDYEDIYQHYLDSNFVPKSVDFINIYDFLKSDQKKKKYPIINHKTEMQGYTVHKVEGKKRTYRYFKDGVYEMYKRFNHPNKNLKFIDYMSPNSSKRIKREEFDQEGYLHRKIYYKQNTLNKTQEIMFKKDGNAYVNRLFKGDPNNTVTSVVYFDKDETYFFDSESDFYKFCFEKIIQPNSQVISDARNLDQALIEMNTDNVKKIAVQHSTFHKLEDTSEVRGAYRYLLDYSKHIDYMVFLTEGQKENWEKFVIIQLTLLQSPTALS